MIGYTTGVFDLMHVGHVRILKNARSICDELIVGVTSDELAFQLKGRRPIIPFADRVEILHAMRYVDHVVTQDRIDEIDDWAKYRFDVIVKGDDWKGSEKWNQLEREFSRLGVAVRYFPYTGRVSTRELRIALEGAV